MSKGRNQAPPENSLTEDERVALVDSIRGYVCRYVRKWTIPGCPPSERAMTGINSCWLAAVRFDPSRGNKFWTYATYYIRSAMQDLAKFYRSRGFTSVGDNQPSQETGNFGGHNYVKEDVSYEEVDELSVVATTNFDELVKLTSRRHRKVLLGIYREGLTLKEIGWQMGICRERVRQLHNQALHELKKAVVRGKVPSLVEFAKGR